MNIYLDGHDFHYETENLCRAFFPNEKITLVYEKTVDLSDCWNEKNLREHKKEIASLFDSNRRLHEEARRYLSAAANLLEEAGRLGAESLFPGKAENAALKICAREIGKKDKKRGTEKQRFLSAVTESGVVFMNRTPEILCERIFAFEDETGAASRVFMNTVRKYALENGFDVITCKCPLFPSEKTEHIFIGEIVMRLVGFDVLQKDEKILIL